MQTAKVVLNQVLMLGQVSDECLGPLQPHQYHSKVPTISHLNIRIPHQDELPFLHTLQFWNPLTEHNKFAYLNIVSNCLEAELWAPTFKKGSRWL